MLGKLIKYDLKSMLKFFIPLWIALLATSVLARFLIQPISHGNRFSPILEIIAMMLYFGLIMSLVVVSVVLIIMRFYNGLLRDEGYLMFTLPVKPWHLICAKGICATIVVLTSFVVGFFSVMIMAFTWDIFRYGIEWSYLGEHLGAYWLTYVLVFFVMLATILKTIFQMYASLAIGHLFSRYRIGWAVGAYIVINIIIMVISVIFARATSLHYLDSSGYMTFDLSSITPNGVLWGALAITLVQLAVFYLITERILTKRLNLE